MKTAAVLALIATLSGVSQACYFDVTSSLVGTFKAQHSEPSDHDGVAQTITGSYLTCSFSGNLLDGCIVDDITETGCGTLTFVQIGTDRRRMGGSRA